MLLSAVLILLTAVFIWVVLTIAAHDHLLPGIVKWFLRICKLCLLLCVKVETDLLEYIEKLPPAFEMGRYKFMNDQPMLPMLTFTTTVATTLCATLPQVHPKLSPPHPCNITLLS